MAKGPFTVLRRSGEALTQGVWASNQDDERCKPGGAYEQSGIKCSERVYGNSGDNLKYFAGAQGEKVTFTGATPSTAWEKGTTFTARIENSVRDSAYRVNFLSVVPADSLKLQNSSSPKVKNVAEVSGSRVEQQGGVAVYVKSEIGASTHKDSANFVIKKEVLPDFRGSDAKEFTVRYTVGEKAGECKVAPGTDCRVEKVALGTEVVFEEVDVQGSKLKWQPGEFTYPNPNGNKTAVEIDGKRATIKKPVPGERVVLVLTNNYSEKTGALQLKKKVEGLNSPNQVPAEIEVDYTCVPAGQPEDSGTTVRERVRTNGEVTTIPNIPVGHECYVRENVSSGEIPAHLIKVKYQPESRKVTIKEGDGDNGSNLVTITNTYTPRTAPLFVKKAIAGERPQGLNDDTEFTVKYRCDADSKVRANQPAELKLKANGDAVKGPEFPLGTRCAVTEEDTTAPKFDDFGVTADLGGEVVISEAAEAATITVTNTFAKEEAKFRIAKAIAGDARDTAVAKTYDFEYVCGTETGRLQVTGAGVVESDKAFPVGTECTVTDLGTEAQGSAQIAHHTLRVTPAVSQRIVVGRAEELAFTNNYTVNTAKFAVAKTAEGEDGHARNQTYRFNYNCGGVTGVIDA